MNSNKTSGTKRRYTDVVHVGKVGVHLHWFIARIYFEDGVLGNEIPPLILEKNVPIQLYKDTIHTINRLCQKTAKKKYLGVFEVCAYSATCCIIVGVIFAVCLVGLACIAVGVMEATKTRQLLASSLYDSKQRINDFLEDMNRNELQEFGIRMEMGEEHSGYDLELRYFVDITKTN